MSNKQDIVISIFAALAITFLLLSVIAAGLGSAMAAPLFYTAAGIIAPIAIIEIVNHVWK